MIRILHVLTSLEGSGGVQKRLIDNYEQMDKKNIHFDFIVHGFERGALEDVVEKMGSHVFHVIPKRNGGFLKNVIQIRRVIKQGHYTIVQSHMEFSGIIPLFFALLYHVKIRIAHSHVAFMQSTGLRKMVNAMASALLNVLATDFWACSKDAGEWLFRRSRSDLRIIPNAIRVDKFQFDPAKRAIVRKQLGLQSRQLAVINVGRLSSQKNQQFLLVLFKEITKAYPDARLYLAGEGELHDSLLTQTKSLGIQDSVVFLGMRNDVNSLMQGMDVMIHPAFYEGLGNVLIEAQAAGLPIVTSRPGIPMETNITKLIKYEDLSAPLSDWVKLVEMQLLLGRQDTAELVENAGYDSRVQGKKLELLYQQLVEIR